MSFRPSEHTPGPWYVESGAVWAEAKDGSNLKIASVHPVLNYVSMGGRNANARLIAAAPDLLDALKRAEGHLADEIHNRHIHPIGHCPVLDWVRAAIAEAEGRA
jgi:hypothetical protein